MSLNINILSQKHYLSNDADSGHLTMSTINLQENPNLESRHSKEIDYIFFGCNEWKLSKSAQICLSKLFF